MGRPRLSPLGDRAILARFDTEAEARDWAAAVRAERMAGVVDLVLAYRSAAVHLDPDAADLDETEGRLRSIQLQTTSAEAGRLIVLPVLYDGPDLAAVARRLGLTEAEVVAQHSTPEYDVFAIGFLPGFPYAGYLPGAIAGLPRLESPRLAVPAGSVAIAGRQTGVYPSESPGGWHLLGRTPYRVVDLALGHFPIRAGDRLRFEPIDPGTFGARLGDLLEPDPSRTGPSVAEDGRTRVHDRTRNGGKLPVVADPRRGSRGPFEVSVGMA
ncbi:MAG TPA: allophanate hydrolase subunit 1 [Isosphaeraceae bacterium]|jgi:KipI family sensor histidine kinase inhibitor|nr:allophanate hydrolase subunit 1 [Isosphaeraceae bacterium]